MERTFLAVAIALNVARSRALQSSHHTATAGILGILLQETVTLSATVVCKNDGVAVTRSASPGSESFTQAQVRNSQSPELEVAAHTQIGCRTCIVFSRQ